MGKYIYAWLVCVLMLASCTVEEEVFVNPSRAGIVSVTASVADFQGVNVGTRTVADDENQINQITMAIFDSDKNIVGGVVHINVKETDPVFMINTKHKEKPEDTEYKPFILYGDNQVINITNEQSALQSCTIYMLANCQDALTGKTIETENDLLSVDLTVGQTLTIPANGFPMVGSQTGVNLSAEGNSATTMQDIVMQKLYSKINVRFQINAENVTNIPKFTLTGWSVHNVPAKVKLRKPGEEDETYSSAQMQTWNSGVYTSLNEGSKSVIHHSISIDNPEYFEFTFYMPEHQVNPDNLNAQGKYDYPANVDDVQKQRFKPKLCTAAKKPVFVKVEGIFTDQNEFEFDVDYNLYLGQNSVDNFHIRRNQELNNMVTIKGITNSDPGSGAIPNISTDYRVNIEHTAPYIVKVEREALLDSHFEVRPMDIYVSKGKVKVEVMDESSTDPNSSRVWLRMEKGRTPANDDATYTGTTGVRKYFTTDLVTSTLQAIGKEMEVASDTRIWLYFDENPNIFDKTYPNNDTYNKRYRDITVKLEYYDENGTHVASGDHEITFRQMNLWRLWSYNESDNNQKLEANKVRYYDIEYHEEYLNNYAADQGFGQTTDGMAWGFNGTTFSGNIGNDLKTQAMIIDLSSANAGTQIIDWLIGQESPYYDFYLPREAKDISASLVNSNNEYAGRRFSSAMINNIVKEFNSLTLEKSPNSAIEYCLNKNKRNVSGNVQNQDWYLPAIDELEEIMVSGYSDFEVFQDKMYWSCQPAFHKSYLHYQTTLANTTDFGGDYYFENETSARATSAKYDALIDDFTYTESGVINDGYYQYLPASLSNIVSSSSPQIISNNIYSFNFKIDYNYSFFGGPVNETRTLNKVEYGLGYKPRSSVHRIRCVRNTGTYSSN